MNTVRIDPQPDGYLRCTHDDGSTFTCEPHQLADHLREYPMVDPKSPPWWQRLLPQFNKE